MLKLTALSVLLPANFTAACQVASRKTATSPGSSRAPSHHLFSSRFNIPVRPQPWPRRISISVFPYRLAHAGPEMRGFNHRKPGMGRLGPEDASPWPGSGLNSVLCPDRRQATEVADSTFCPHRVDHSLHPYGGSTICLGTCGELFTLILMTCPKTISANLTT